VIGDGPALPVIKSSSVKLLYPVAKNIRVELLRRPSQQPRPGIGRGQLLNRVGNLIREIAGGDEVRYQTISQRVSFLIPVDSMSVPITVELEQSLGTRSTHTLIASDDTDAYATSLNQWWSEFSDRAGEVIRDADTPPHTQLYLTSMLSRRLNLPLPDWYTDETSLGVTDPAQFNPLLETAHWISGGRSISDGMLSRAATSQHASPVNEWVTLPPPVKWQPPLAPETSTDVVTEPLADAVPPECFYLRYGSFLNFLWFQDLASEFGGDISRMITLSGINSNGPRRLEKQLGIKTSAMARLLGPTLIEDQALIGTDLFLDEGPSMGVIMRSTNAFLLRASLMNDRNALAASDQAITITDVDLPHGTANLIRRADNVVRSYMVQHDQTFLITNSETIADRFLEVGQTKASLAKTPGFRHARARLPLTRDDSIFAYLSPQMLQGLISPASLVELRRRKQAEAEIALAHLARLAFQNERSESNASLPSVDDLIDMGYLPSRFADRVDQSGLVAVGESWVDSMRGARGSFVPIADQVIEKVTEDEARWVAQITQGYEDQFARIDPIFVGIHRERLDANENDPESETLDLLEIHAEISPWQMDQYGWWAKQLGPPTDVAMQFPDDDLIAVQAHVASDTLGPATHLFVGIKDSSPPEPESFDGLVGSYLSLKQLPGYLGAWPYPGALDRLPLGLGRGIPVRSQTGPAGMTRLIGGVYRYTGGGFSILSMRSDVLNESLPKLAATQSESLAQIRGRVGSLKDSQLEGWVNKQLLKRDLVTSQTGAAFLTSLHQQFGVSGDELTAVAATILGGRPECPLGGNYAITESERSGERDFVSSSRVTSSAWERSDKDRQIAPLLTWFRGLSGEVTQRSSGLQVTASIQVARQLGGEKIAAPK
ncbi:MAG: hypothetical protein AAF745_10000, partial [Planctomycetota bacterium]